MLRRTLTLALSLAVSAAHAQIGVPGVRVPLQLPQTPVVSRALAGVDAQLDTSALQDLRSVQVSALIRRNRATIEADPTGAAILRSEIVALSPSDADLAVAQNAGFTVLSTRNLDGLDLRMVVLRAPQGLSTARALTRIRTLIPGGSFDFDHLYSESGAVGASEPAESAAAVPPETAATPQIRIGLIDGGVDGAHPVFRDVPLHRHGCSDAAVPSAHGTAVASLMVGHSSDFHGAAAGAELYAVDVYCGLPTGGAVDAVADGLAWLVHERVPVVNVSLVGPPNLILERVVKEVIDHGVIVVAAVGNDGPAAKPLYPASYPGVVGVTAVDAHRRVLVEAGRGPQVRFAAPGADMVAAKTPEGFEAVRGTSFAAPLVACLLAAPLRVPDTAAAARSISELESHAIHLGSSGTNSTFGYGLVGADLGPDIRLAGLRPR